MTSYRSAPAITDLFSSLLSEEERGRVSSVQRDEVPPRIRVLSSEDEHAAALRETVAEARRLSDENHGIAAVVVPWKSQARRIQAILGDDAPRLMGRQDTLPESGVILITLELAKGLEFDHVIVPDASGELFPDEPLARRRLYTTISRATRRVDVLALKSLTPLLTGKRWGSELGGKGRIGGFGEPFRIGGLRELHRAAAPDVPAVARRTDGSTAAGRSDEPSLPVGLTSLPLPACPTSPPSPNG